MDGMRLWPLSANVSFFRGYDFSPMPFSAMKISPCPFVSGSPWRQWTFPCRNRCVADDGWMVGSCGCFLESRSQHLHFLTEVMNKSRIWYLQTWLGRSLSRFSSNDTCLPF